MKMNKKGFTLIEMLVVIAIIAVLVSIVIPIVGSSTDKAGAATNAANLRAMVAEATTKMLASDASNTGNVTLAFTDGKVTGITVSASAPKSQKVGTTCAKNTAATLYWDGSQFHAYYGSSALADFAAVADGTKAASELGQTTAPSGTGVVTSTTAS